jgi:hypothetical protein
VFSYAEKDYDAGDLQGYSYPSIIESSYDYVDSWVSYSYSYDYYACAVDCNYNCTNWLAGTCGASCPDEVAASLNSICSESMYSYSLGDSEGFSYPAVVESSYDVEYAESVVSYSFSYGADSEWPECVHDCSPCVMDGDTWCVDDCSSDELTTACAKCVEYGFDMSAVCGESPSAHSYEYSASYYEATIDGDDDVASFAYSAYYSAEYSFSFSDSASESVVVTATIGLSNMTCDSCASSRRACSVCILPAASCLTSAPACVWRHSR